MALIDRRVHPIHFSAAQFFPPAVLLILTHRQTRENYEWQRTKEAERKQKKAVSLCSQEECGNVPAPCQSSLKGVKAAEAQFTSVGKLGRDGAHRQTLHSPGYVGKDGRTKKRVASRVNCTFFLSDDIRQNSCTGIEWVFFVCGRNTPPFFSLSLSCSCGTAKGWGLVHAPSDYLCGPA